MLSSMLYGLRVSLVVGFAGVVVAMILGVGLGLLSGFMGGVVDAFIMRIADMILSFPAILVALLINGIALSFLPQEVMNEAAIYVLILAIALTSWVQYARTVRSSTMVEKSRSTSRPPR
ncbi:ABC transporter permease subunit [Marinobacterium aestuariivivens]|uniref:ABC transporter permease subunit n=1 Tax=Marinobacterium aestuariivivens TaxID=1698799 RepID=A0ABW2A874_9GAMM